MSFSLGNIRLQLPLILCSIALYFLPLNVFAQYDEYRYPQDKEEIAKFRKLKVRIEDKYPDNDSVKGAHIIREFDTLGRIISFISQYNRKHYEYDAKGRLINYIDSARGANDFIRSDFEFQYEGPGGRLSFARVDPFSLTFKYNEEKKMLFESAMVDFEQYRQRYFYYDAQGRLKEEQWVYPKEHGKEKSRYITLNREGKPTREIIIKYYLNGGLDSEFVTHQYDDKNRELEMKTISTTHSKPDGFSSQPVISSIEIDTSTYLYTYNNYGKSSEIFHYSIKGYDHSYEWWFDKKGLKYEEIYFSQAKNSTQHSLYRYTFYEPKKVAATPKK